MSLPLHAAARGVKFFYMVSVSEVSAYRILKAHDLITSPAFVVIKAADEFEED
jgi:hypothetical protein